MKRTPTLIPLPALSEAAECLKTIAHPCRLRMLQLLLSGSHSVGELADSCELPSHMASEHLGLMRDRGLLMSQREGRKVYYTIAETGLKSIMNCIENRFG